MLKKGTILLVSFIIFAAAVAAWASAKTEKQLSDGIRYYDENDFDKARDNFIDVMMHGTPQEAQEANQYINKIHAQLGGGTAPTPVAAPEDNAELREYYKSAAAVGYDQGPSHIGHVLGEPAPSYSASGSGDDAFYGSARNSSANVTEEERERSEKFVFTSLRRHAIDSLENSKGVKVYFRNDDVDAVDIDAKVLFDAPTKFSAAGRKILEHIYTLMVLSPKPVFVVLPPGSYTDNVDLGGVKNAVSLSAYLIYRGISPAKLSYNMGLYNEEPPAKFSNLDGLSIVFDYDTAPELKIPNSGEKLPVMSLAVAPASQAMYEDAEGGMFIDYSVAQTASPVREWTLQIVQHSANGKYYVVRQLEGNGPVYSQIFWNGRSGGYGAKLPAGAYTAVLSATDNDGKIKTLRRKLEIVAVSKKASASAGSSAAPNYKDKRLWTKPGRKMVGAGETSYDDSSYDDASYNSDNNYPAQAPGADYGSPSSYAAGQQQQEPAQQDAGANGEYYEYSY